MRVISGTARRLQLKTIDGLDTRPTTDRIKETLFNMIHNEIADCRFLDLYSGSGGIGIEALSRGAEEAVFVEKNPRAVQCIKENLTFTKLQDKARVMTDEVVTAIRKLDGEKPFDIIFLDPPYHMLEEKRVLEALHTTTLVDAHTLIIVEASLDTGFDYVGSMGFEINKEKNYKTNKHVFIILKEEA